ncbi:protein FAM135B isoform X2 [Ambystoma mexicanum]|uniref:protein FAM135B isoform X2 n=1 Tax=Ambystoma mexicanum TaxID=8296 RepID=UPI0037E8C9BE
MSEVQGTVEFSVDLHKFHNVDLFQRGYYQVRTALKLPSRVPHRLVATHVGLTDDADPYSACIYEHNVYSRIFQILYRNEDIILNESMRFKVHMLLDGEKVEEALSEVDFQLKLDLHFTDSEQQLKDVPAMPLISTRTLGLHFHPRRGLHHHVPVMFDYFHLSVISVTVHASLVALHQPLTSFTRPGKGSWLGKGSQEISYEKTVTPLQSILFGVAYFKSSSSEGGSYIPSETCKQRAYKWHRDICHLLLSAYKGLFSYYSVLTKGVCILPQSILDRVTLEEALCNLCSELQTKDNPETITEQISTDLAWLCTELAALWVHFLGSVTLHPKFTAYLKQEHHTLRVRRFSEAFFYKEHQKLAMLTFQEHLIQCHNHISFELRNSEYLTSMPPLPIECLDIDGDWNSLPIIFEDRYVECLTTDDNEDTSSSCISQVLECVDMDLPMDAKKFICEIEDVTDEDGICRDSPVLSSHRANGFLKSSCNTSTRGCVDKGAGHHDHSPIGAPPNAILQHFQIDTFVPPGFQEKKQCSRDILEDTESNILETIKADELNQNICTEPAPQRAHHGGVTLIEVKPPTTDPYRGDTVFVISQAKRAGEESALPMHTFTEVPVVGTSENKVEAENCHAEAFNCIHQDESDRNSIFSPLNRTLPKTHHCDLSAKLGKDTLDVKSWMKDHHSSESDESHLTSGAIKRSSSLISDSGIESEPSSVAWSDARSRPLDLPNDRELLQQSVKSHTRHRNSFSGGHTGSNTSLPSGIQASLTSISSLPFEDDEREVQLAKLTKSVSAPQINSPEEAEEHASFLKQEKVLLELSDGKVLKFVKDHLEDRQNEAWPSVPDIAEVEKTKAGITKGVSLDTIIPQTDITRDFGNMANFTVGKCRLKFNYEPFASQQPNVDIGCAELDGSKDLDLEEHTRHLLETPFFAPDSESETESCLSAVLHIEDLTSTNIKDLGHCAKSYHKVPNFSNTLPSQGNSQLDVIRLTREYDRGRARCDGLFPEEDNILQDIELEDNFVIGAYSDVDCRSLSKEECTNDNNHAESNNRFLILGLEGNLPSPNINALALESRKAVESVNLSVSCTATCLPFSSIIKETPAMVGFSSKQTSFPITHQPLGSFGVISHGSIHLDEESNERMISFHQAKEKFLKELKFDGCLYSGLAVLASEMPYFPPEEDETLFEDGIHLVICVHGLDGNSADLRLVKTFIELGLPEAKLDFLMSERNQNDTFADFDAMTDRLIDEIIQHIQLYNLSIAKISFIGHSLGTIIIRSVLTRPRFRYYLNKLHTFLSLSGPHLGTLYNNSTLVSTGLWLMQKFKKSGSLLQLTFRDNADPRKSFLYQLSQKPGLQYFKNVVLVASPQDRYVPFHSARIEMCKTALKDKHTGPVYTEMVNNLLQPVVEARDCTLIRHNVFHALPNTANTLIGRAAHIAVLDSELFLEKFFLVAGLSYFK